MRLLPNKINSRILNGRIGVLFGGWGGDTGPAPSPTLNALGGTFTLAEDAAQGDPAGTITSKTSGSTLSLTDNAGGRVALSGSNGIVRGATALDYEAAASHSFTVRETLAGATNSPRDTVLSLTVTNVADGPSLNTLTLSASTIEESSEQGAVVGAIQGKTSGSTLSLTGNDGGRFQLDGLNIEAGPTEIIYSEGTPRSITIRETLADSPNSPRDTVLSIAVTEAAAPSGIRYGRTENFNGGTDFDYIVASDGSGDFTTIEAAWDQAVSDNALRSIGVRDGVYREKLVKSGYSGPGITVSRYGTEEPVVTGALRVTGFAQCTSGDEAVVGSEYSSIYKATINASDLEHTSYHALIPTEDGELLDLVQRRADESNLFILDEYGTFFSQAADGCTATVDGEGHLETITHAAVLEAYTDVQLANCSVSFHAIPNEAHFVKVASASGGVLTVAENDSAPQGDGNFKYSLLNILPELSQGQWGAVPSGDGTTVTLYVWPNNPANIDKIDIAAREFAVSLNSCSTVAIKGLTFQQTTSSLANRGIPINVISCPDFLLEECLIEKYSHHDKGYGAIYLRDCDGGVIRYCEANKGQSAFGFYINGGEDPRGRNLLIADVTQSPIRGYRGTRPAFVDVQPIRCGAGAHANLGNFYQGCTDPIVIGYNPKTDPANRPIKGYFPIQECAGFTILHSILPPGPDGRALVDQYNNTAPPYSGSMNRAINCMIPHAPDRISSSGGAANAVLCNPNWDMNWTLANCIVPAAKIYDGIGGPPVGTLTRLNNILTNQDAVDPSETRAHPLAVYNDPDAGDFRTLPGSLLLTKAGSDVSDDIEALAIKYPDLAERLYQDIDGNDWLPEDPGIGPWGKQTPVVDSGDVTAPVATDLEVTQDSGTVTITFSVDEANTNLVYSLDDGENPPITGSQWSTSSGAQTINVAAVPEGTYDVSVQPIDRNGNSGNILTGSIEVTGGATGDPTEWLVSNGGYLVDPANVPSGTIRITNRGKFRFPTLAGTCALFAQASTGCDLRITDGDEFRFIVENSSGAQLINEVLSPGPILETGVWYDFIYDANMATATVTMTLNGVAYSRPLTGSTNTFQTTRNVSFLAYTNGTNLVPAGTEFADLSVEYNGVTHKAFSNTAATANSDPWKAGSDFTQGGA